MPDYTIGVLEDALHVVEIFANGKDRLTLTEVTKESALSKNKVFRILSTLEKHRYVGRDEAGAYALGVRFLEFGHRVQAQMSLFEVARPVLDWLVDETEESIFLAVIDGPEVLLVDARESPRSVRLTGKAGGRGPLYAGGTPKVLLAYLPQEERDALLEQIELVPITPYTITNKRDLEVLLSQIREQGYIVTADDVDVGAHSVAAPIRNYQDRVVAAISIAGPSPRFSDEKISIYTQLILEAAAKISRAIGCKGY